jgi:hypothetical protein
MRIAGQRDTSGSAPAPELIGGHPGIGSDNAGGEEEAKLGCFAEDRHVTGNEPYDRTRHEQDRQRLASVEDAGAHPRHGISKKQDRVGDVDRDRIRHRSVHAEQADRACPHQMRAAPPGDGMDLGVLDPREQQQQSEDCLDIDSNQEQGVDVETHQTITE